jgi:hypothetical protein
MWVDSGPNCSKLYSEGGDSCLPEVPPVPMVRCELSGSSECATIYHEYLFKQDKRNNNHEE